MKFTEEQAKKFYRGSLIKKINAKEQKVVIEVLVQVGHGVQGHAVVVHLEEGRDAGAQLALVWGADDHDLHALLISRAALNA